MNGSGRQMRSWGARGECATAGGNARPAESLLSEPNRFHARHHALDAATSHLKLSTSSRNDGHIRRRVLRQVQEARDPIAFYVEPEEAWKTVVLPISPTVAQCECLAKKRRRDRRTQRLCR